MVGQLQVLYYNINFQSARSRCKNMVQSIIDGKVEELSIKRPAMSSCLCMVFKKVNTDGLWNSTLVAHF